MSLPGPGLPLWRQVLRGFSQCAFQANALAGAVFLGAVAAFSPRMAAFYAISALVGTLVARGLNGSRSLLDLGLFGFNPALMGLALGNFFAPSPMLWLCVPVLAAITAAVTVAMSRWLPWPFLAAPFVLTLWGVWPFTEQLGLARIELPPFESANVAWARGTISALGFALFAPATITSLLFLAGLAVSSWRHAVVALLGAFTAVALAAQAGASGGAINSGFVAFNAVLAALAAYSIVAPDLRLVALASVLATWFASYVIRGAPVPVLASGFILAIWFMLFLGWLNPRFAGKAPDTTAGSG